MSNRKARSAARFQTDALPIMEGREQVGELRYTQLNVENATLAELVALRCIVLALIEVSPRKEYVEDKLTKIIDSGISGSSLGHGIRLPDNRRKEIGNLARRHLTETLEAI